METISEVTANKPRRNRGGRALGGLIVVGVGVVLLLKQMNTVIFPYWLFTWPFFLIVLGFYLGVRRQFRGWGGWVILMLVGGAFLVRDYFPQYEISDYIWPIGIIIVGLFLMLRPKRSIDWEKMHDKHRERHWKKWENWEKWENYGSSASNGDDFIDSTSIFGGAHKVVVSKNFKGGDIVNIFGGCEINLTQADFTGKVTLDIVQIFGGANIIVPTDWKVVISSSSIFGQVDDKRPTSLIKENPDKTLVIEGTSIFAGISIQCY